MTARLVLLLACLLAYASASHAQTPPDDGIAPLLASVQRALESGDQDALRSLIAPGGLAGQIEDFVTDLVRPDTRRAIIHERERIALDDVAAGDGYRILIEAFLETAGRARIATSLIDVRRPTGGDANSWRIVGAQGLTALEGLYRLRINPASQLAARHLVINADDLTLTLEEGSAFLVESEEGVTGLVLLGRGEMRFAPAPATEKGQLRIFSGAEILTTPFDSAYVRLHPSEYEARVSTGSLTPTAVNSRQMRRALEVFARESPKSFNLDLSELSADTWFLLPTPGDFLADIQTRKYGTLTYTRAGAQLEDITLFDRGKGRTIALYPSAARGPGADSFTEDELKEYDVLDYNVTATISPERQFIDGLVRMRIRIQANQLSSLSMRLADTLSVNAVVTADYGRLMPLRVRNQNTVIVSLPVTLTRDTELTLIVSYSGRLESQDIDAEGLQVADAPAPPPVMPSQDEGFLTMERNFLLSSRSFWYPQNTVSDYATASMRITVPQEYTCVASGNLGTDNDVTLRDLLTLPTEGRSFVFRAVEPLRYLALVVSRFVRIGEATVALTSRGNALRNSVRVAVDANPRLQTRGRGLLVEAQDIMRFYSGLMGDAPYASATMALVEDELPGGHSPGYFAVLNNPLPNSPYVWRNDPAAFQGFPEFFAAHELAHQWWGQAVGWRNYHEQWLSEGFAQYFAALYARQSRGEPVFNAMLRQFRRWALAEADEGPISLGYRLGHIKGNSRVFRALVYNKGAAVLHMLRRTVGDDTFFNALRRFYTEQRFQKAGTQDLRRVFEAESGRSLDRFFNQWIYGSDVPRFRYTTTVGGGAVLVRFDEINGKRFELPVTVTITYTDGRTQDVLVQIDEVRVEQRIPVARAVRQVQVNRDFAAIGYFEER